jgi:hypothetical protein
MLHYRLPGAGGLEDSPSPATPNDDPAAVTRPGGVRAVRLAAAMRASGDDREHRRRWAGRDSRRSSAGCRLSERTPPLSSRWPADYQPTKEWGSECLLGHREKVRTGAAMSMACSAGRRRSRTAPGRTDPAVTMPMPRVDGMPELSALHSCIKAKGVLAVVQSNKGGASGPLENCDKPGIQGPASGRASVTSLGGPMAQCNSARATDPASTGSVRTSAARCGTSSRCGRRYLVARIFQFRKKFHPRVGRSGFSQRSADIIAISRQHSNAYR